MSIFCSKCLNFYASDYLLNSQYFSMIFVAMYLYDYSLDAGTKIFKIFSVLTKLEKWPSESVCKELHPQFLLFWLQTKEKILSWLFCRCPYKFCSKKVIVMGRTGGALPSAAPQKAVCVCWKLLIQFLSDFFQINLIVLFRCYLRCMYKLFCKKHSEKGVF